jgi:hypothetical protein
MEHGHQAPSAWAAPPAPALPTPPPTPRAPRAAEDRKGKRKLEVRLAGLDEEAAGAEVAGEAVLTPPSSHSGFFLSSATAASSATVAAAVSSCSSSSSSSSSWSASSSSVDPATGTPAGSLGAATALRKDREPLSDSSYREVGSTRANREVPVLAHSACNSLLPDDIDTAAAALHPSPHPSLPLLPDNDFVSSMPFELRLRVLSFLDVGSLIRAACVSRAWRAAAHDGSLWSALDLNGSMLLSESATTSSLCQLLSRSGMFLRVCLLLPPLFSFFFFLFLAMILTKLSTFA